MGGGLGVRLNGALSDKPNNMKKKIICKPKNNR